jgi:hypothetical protein
MLYGVYLYASIYNSGSTLYGFYVFHLGLYYGLIREVLTEKLNSMTRRGGMERQVYTFSSMERSAGKSS